jgi:Tfp pilus assembly protein PilX
MANGWCGLTLLGVLNRGTVADATAMRPKLRRLDDLCSRSRLVREERGIALVMALGIMLVLTVVLSTVMFLTAAGARDASRSNAGQKAHALAESGIANALAVLNANYPGSTIFPGDKTLLSTPVTSTYSSGTATWSGSLVSAPATATWKWEWHVTSTGRVANPTGPTSSDVTRTITAVVPVTIPTSTSINPNNSAIDFVYAKQDINFGQSMNVRSPIYAGRNLTLSNTATIDEVIPASATGPARPNKVAVAGNMLLSQPQNQVGHIDSTPGNLGEVHVVGTCNGHATPCAAADKVYATTSDNTIPPDFVVPPTLTCCAPIAYGGAVDGTTYPPSPVTDPITGQPNASYMGFWYQNADLGPKALCSSPTGSPPNFDTSTGTPDLSINQSAYSLTAPFDLTGTPYTCKSANNSGELSWDGSVLTIKGNVFIDGSVTSSAGSGPTSPAKYKGQGTLILSGGFVMTNKEALCVNVSGSNCDPSGPWDPNAQALAIVAFGVFSDGNSVSIKQGQFQGLLVGNQNVYCDPASGTLVQGPMVSVHASVSCGQSGELRFPAISFASSGQDGLTGPLPLPVLQPPIQFGGG